MAMNCRNFSYRLELWRGSFKEIEGMISECFVLPKLTSLLPLPSCGKAELALVCVAT